MSLKYIISWTAPLTTYGMFLSPIPTCYEFVKKGYSDSVSCIPFLTNFLCGFLWLRYGLLKNESTVIQVNVVNLVLQMIFILTYYIFAKNKAGVINKALLFAAVGIFASVLVLISPPHLAADRLGPICTIVNILAFASPLAGLQDVIQSKSTANLPFLLIFMGLLVSAQWFLYGYLSNDAYMQIPNGIGIILSLLQLALFAIYPSNKSSESESHRIAKKRIQ